MRARRRGADRVDDDLSRPRVARYALTPRAASHASCILPSGSRKGRDGARVEQHDKGVIPEQPDQDRRSAVVGRRVRGVDRIQHARGIVICSITADGRAQGGPKGSALLARAGVAMQAAARAARMRVVMAGFRSEMRGEALRKSRVTSESGRHLRRPLSSSPYRDRPAREYVRPAIQRL